MKKRTVAILLSMIMCLAPAAEAGAASVGTEEAVAAIDEGAFTSDEFTSEPEVIPLPEEQTGEETVPEENSTVEVIPDEETSSDSVEEPTDPDTPSETEIFDEGDNGDTADAAEEDIIDVQIFSDAEGSETESEAVLEAGDTSVLTAARSDWEEVNKTIKLKKGSGGYYTAADGIIQVQTEGHTGYYLFDESGYLVTGNKSVSAGTPGFTLAAAAELYFTDKTAAQLYSEYANEAVTPWSSDLGQQKKDFWWWSGTAFRYYDKTGKYISAGALKISGTLKEINGEYYCLSDYGVPCTGYRTLTVNGKSAQYYFQPTGDIPGKMFHGGWHKLIQNGKERWLYYSPEASTLGQKKVHGTIATQLDTKIKGSSTYLIDKNGYILKSTMTKASNGYYCTNSNGVIYRDKLVKYKGARYYFRSNGTRATWKNSWHRCPGADNRMYYFGNTAGKVAEKKGWQKVTTSAGKFYGWFYYKDSGEHYKNQLTTKGYFKEDGRLASGVTKVGKKTYFFEVSNSKTHRGKMLKGTLISYKGSWYYANSKGELRESGWKKIKNNWYYFKDFKAVTNKFIKKGSTYGMLDKTGKFCTGWITVSSVNNKVRYINPTRPGFYKNCVKKIDGLWYRFDKDGYRVNDRTNEYKGPYHVVVDRMNCVATVYNMKKNVPVKSIRISCGNPREWTPLGTYALVRAGRWQMLMGPCWAQYGTYLWGANNNSILFHSVPGYTGGNPDPYAMPGEYYNLLGVPASHGCIRCCVADAKFIWDNAPGSVVTVIPGTYVEDDAFKGPLGKNPLVPLRGAGNFDPTDPALPENQ